MILDTTMNKWVLTEQEVLDELNINLTSFLGDVNKVEPLLKEVSQDVYLYAQTQTLIENADAVIVGLNQSEQLTKQALLSQVRFIVRSRGGHLLKDQMLANPATGVVLGDDVYERAISTQTKQYLKQTGLLKQVVYSV